MSQVEGPLVAVVEIPECLLPRHRLQLFLLKHFQELRRLGESCSGIGRKPAIGIMRRELPAGRAAHGKTSHADAVFINSVTLLHILQSFQDVDFARELERVAIATVGMQHDRVIRSKLTGVLHAVPQEIHFAQLFASPVKPDVAASRHAVINGIRRRNHQTIRLHGVVDAADVASYDKPLLSDPFRLASQQLIRSLDAFDQQSIGFVEFFDVKELLIVQSTSDGSLEDHDVRQQSNLHCVLRFSNGRDLILNHLQLSSHRVRSIRRNINTQLRNASDLVGDVVLNPVCVKSRGEQQHDDQQTYAVQLRQSRQKSSHDSTPDEGGQGKARPAGYSPRFE